MGNLLKHWPALDKFADRASYWPQFVGTLSTVLLPLWGVMTWAAHSITSVAQYGWGAAVFAGLGVLCVAALVLSIAAILFAAALRKIWPSERAAPRANSLAAQQPTSGANDSDKIRQLNRTAFLVATNAIQDVYSRRISEARRLVPRGGAPFDTDEKMQAETARINQFISDLQANLVGSHWIAELERRYLDTVHDADNMIVKAGVPESLNVVLYRLFTIASMRRDYIDTWLQAAVVEAQGHEAQMLQMLRERPNLHR